MSKSRVRPAFFVGIGVLRPRWPTIEIDLMFIHCENNLADFDAVPYSIQTDSLLQRQALSKLN